MAKDEVFAMLDKHRPRGVVHCFSEGIEFAEKLFSIDIMISFTGVLTYESSKKIQEAAQKGGISKMMLETDSPFLKPGKKRTEDRAEPKDVVEIAQKIAELRGISLEEVAKITTENAERLFHI
jgi:TatD DNase family protein